MEASGMALGVDPRFVAAGGESLQEYGREV